MERKVQPITEQQNSLTSSIDQVDPEQIVRLLREVDSQLFSGFGGYEGLLDPRVQHACLSLATSIRQLLLHHILPDSKETDCRVVLTGSGTSGRIAFIICRQFNLALQQLGLPPMFTYCISGGDPALIASDELPEDDPAAGIKDMLERTKGASRIVLVGITCGLSAPYACGQVQFAMRPSETAKFTATCMMGFNPKHLSRKVAVEGWEHTCHSVVAELWEKSQKDPSRFVLLNPVVGPEAVTGSSRMKGGSTTLILLHAACSAAFASVFSAPVLQTLGCSAYSNLAPLEKAVDQDLGEAVLSTTLNFERVYRRAYLKPAEIGQLVDTAGRCLRSGGHLYYVGTGLAGVMGLVDASEMPDTYGCPFEEVRGFVPGGWLQGVLNTDGDLSAKGAIFALDTSDFHASILPGLSPNDFVVGVEILGNSLLNADSSSSWPDAVRSVLQQSVKHGAKVAHVCVKEGSSNFLDEEATPEIEGALRLDIAVGSFASQPFDLGLLGCFALKLVTNAITTGGMVLKGATVSNKLVCMTLANNKIFCRGVDTVAGLSGCSQHQALLAICQAVSGVDDQAKLEKMSTSPVSELATLCIPKPQTLSLAILLACSPGMKAEEAHKLLSQEPVVRLALAQYKRRTSAL